MGAGKKRRSCAWSPSRGVTSKSPMHAGAASSPGPHARLARRARQRRRSYQSGKGRATNRGGPEGRHGASVVGARRGESTAPGAASAARAGVGWLVLLGDPPSFDEDDSDPHCCVKPLDAVTLAVACGGRGVSDSTWAAGLLFGADGVAVTVSVDRTAGMPPRPPRLPRSPRQSRLRCRTSAASRRAPRMFPTSHEAAACRI